MGGGGEYSLHLQFRYWFLSFPFHLLRHAPKKDKDMIFFLYVDLIKMSLAPGKQNYPMDLFPMENSPGSEHHSEVNKIQRMIYDQLFPTPNLHPNHTPYSRFMNSSLGKEIIQVRWVFGGFISQWLFDSFHIIFSACHHFRYRDLPYLQGALFEIQHIMHAFDF